MRMILPKNSDFAVDYLVLDDSYDGKLVIKNDTKIKVRCTKSHLSYQELKALQLCLD